MHARCVAAVLVGVGAAVASQTQAAIVFSFADPGPGQEILHFEGRPVLDGPPAVEGVTVDTQPGVLVALEDRVFDFVIDASDDGFGVHIVPAKLWMFVEVGQVFDTLSPVLTAPAQGGFALVDPETNDPYIVGAGSMALSFAGTSGALFASSESMQRDFFYLAGPALRRELPLLEFLGPTFDASFALANAEIDNTLVNDFGFLKTFVSDVAFVGSAEASFVPAPGSAALLGAGGLFLTSRRRRAA